MTDPNNPRLTAVPVRSLAALRAVPEDVMARVASTFAAYKEATRRFNLCRRADSRQAAGDRMNEADRAYRAAAAERDEHVARARQGDPPKGPAKVDPDPRPIVAGRRRAIGPQGSRIGSPPRKRPRGGNYPSLVAAGRREGERQRAAQLLELAWRVIDRYGEVPLGDAPSVMVALATAWLLVTGVKDEEISARLSAARERVESEDRAESDE